MMSNSFASFFAYLRKNSVASSVTTSVSASSTLNAARFAAISAHIFRERSTKVTCAAPRESASIPTAPEPAHRSRNRTPSILGARILKSVSRKRSEVGRVCSEGGLFSFRPRNWPATIRNQALHLLLNGLSNSTGRTPRDVRRPVGAAARYGSFFFASAAKAISFAVRPNGLVKGRLRLLAAWLPLLPIRHVGPAIHSINRDPSDTKLGFVLAFQNNESITQISVKPRQSATIIDSLPVG